MKMDVNIKEHSQMEIFKISERFLMNLDKQQIEEYGKMAFQLKKTYDQSFFHRNHIIFIFLQELICYQRGEDFKMVRYTIFSEYFHYIFQITENKQINHSISQKYIYDSVLFINNCRILTNYRFQQISRCFILCFNSKSTPDQLQQNIEMMLNMEYHDIEMQQLDEASNLTKLMRSKQKIKTFHFMEYLNNKKNRQQNKVKDDFCKEFKGLSLNIHSTQSFYMRNDSFISMKQKNLSGLSTMNSSMLSINEEKQYAKQIRQNNRKIFLVEMKQNEEYSLNGTGVIKLKDGRTIFGTWQSGLISGIIKMIYPSGNTYIGDVIDYTRHGYGELTFSNGDKYTGTFVNGKMEGFGKMFYKQSSITIQGIWQDGVYLQR